MNVLLVEGFHDAALIRAICNRNFESIEFRIEPISGLQRPDNDDARLNSILAPWVSGRNINSVGLVFDADEDPQRIWRRVQRLPILAKTEPQIDTTSLTGCGYVALCQIGPLEINVGVWVMPDNHNPGQLEDFVLRLVPDDDPAKAPAQDYIAGLPEEHFQLSDHRVAKHVAHSWLSAYYPGWSFEDALMNGQMDDLSNDAVGAEFLDWLSRLSS